MKSGKKALATLKIDHSTSKNDKNQSHYSPAGSGMSVILTS